MPILKTSAAQRAAAKRYYETPKGKTARQRYRASPEGRAALAAAQQKYRESPKGRAAYERAKAGARERYVTRVRALMTEDARRDLRRRRIAMGLPPDPPAPSNYRGRGFLEVATAERLRPEYIAAALALEDLNDGVGL